MKGSFRSYFQVSPYSQTLPLSGTMITKVQLLDKAFKEPVHRKGGRNYPLRKASLTGI